MSHFNALAESQIDIEKIFSRLEGAGFTRIKTFKKLAAAELDISDQLDALLETEGEEEAKKFSGQTTESLDKQLDAAHDLPARTVEQVKAKRVLVLALQNALFALDDGTQ